MARVIYSALIDKIQGSIGGTTFQQNAYGFTVKKKPNVVNKRRPLQLSSRNRIGKVAREWQLLSQANRDAWEAYAVSYPRPSKNNPASNLNGFNYFQAVHNYRFLFGQSTLSSPVSTQYTDGYDQSEIGILTGNLYSLIEVAGQTGSWRWGVFLSYPVSETLNFVKPRTRFINSSNVVNSEVLINTDYVNVFGIAPTAGQFVAYKLVSIQLTNGQINVRQFGRVEVLN